MTDVDRGAFLGTIGAHQMVDGVAHIGYWTAAPSRGRRADVATYPLVAADR